MNGEGQLGALGVVSRRRWLKLALGGGVILSSGTGGLLWLRGAAPDVAGLRHLSAHEHRTLSALARTHLPRGGAFALGADDVDLARAFDVFLEGEPDENVRDLKRALFLVELGPILFDRRLRTFSNLDAAEQLLHWERWMTSSSLLRRQVSFAFRKFFSVVFFDQPAVWAHVGYPGPVVQRGAP